MNSKLSGKIKKAPVVEEIQIKPRTEEQIQSVVKNVRSGDASHPEVVLIGEAELQRMKNNATVVLRYQIFQIQIMIVSQQAKKNNCIRKNCLRNKRRSII